MTIDDNLQSLRPWQAPSRRVFVATSLISGFTLAAGPIQAQTAIRTPADGLEAGEVQIPVAGGSMAAYRAMPAAGGPFPVVLVIPEIFGVHEYLKDVCRRLAQLGYMGISGDLFARQGDLAKAENAQAAMAIVRATPTDQVMADLDAMAAWAKASGKGNIDKLAVTGFCNGGRLTLLYAAHNPRLKAAVAWYGHLATPATPQWPKNPMDVVGQIRVPVLGLYGETDNGIPVADVKKFEAALKQTSPKSMFVTYPDAGHAFHADYRPTYRQGPAEDGWKRLQAWLTANGVV